MATAADQQPAPDGGEREFTVDELAAHVGITVRNVRAYAARGLLPPPRMVGRTGYYGRAHVARLLLVREMLAEGFSLAMIERTLASAPSTASSATLALHHALLAPWLPPEPEETTGAELAARAGVPESTALVDQLVDLGLVERLGDGRLRVHDPALLVSGLQVVELGVPPERLIAAQAEVNEHVRAVARRYVQLIVDTAWRDLVGAGAPLDAVRDLGARLQPVAAQAVLAAFRTEMAAAVQEAVERELSRLADPR
ncbi:MerR family transcriptional regulator [Geodermatophilus chilensis]|uniref:MerR family transcriptional regulator n=1 Tax=Geodermatophilus chilensis TaxID=2035835 RepID=UPI0018E46222|nr:MerR family transcriptional regulator [Geodermatophilus chilensis]